MKYRELFTGDNAIFKGVFSVEYPTQYAAIFEDISPEKIDAYAMLNYGGKTVADGITADNCKDIVSAVIAVNVQGWEREAAAMLADYDITNPTIQERTITENETENESSDGTKTDADVPFNASDFTDRDKTTDSGTKDRTSERKTTETTKGTGSAKTISQEIEKELRLRRDKWRKNIIFAVVSELTTKVYE